MKVGTELNNLAILALDLDSPVGWAVGRGGVVADYGAINLLAGPLPYDVSRAWLAAKVAHADIVCYDRSPHLRPPKPDREKKKSRPPYEALIECLRAVCHDSRTALAGVPTTPIKKHHLGTGIANRGNLTQAMVERGHATVDDVEALALSLAYYAMEQPGWKVLRWCQPRA